jgi:hypothetical protein
MNAEALKSWADVEDHGPNRDRMQQAAERMGDLERAVRFLLPYFKHDGSDEADEGIKAVRRLMQQSS